MTIVQSHGNPLGRQCFVIVNLSRLLLILFLAAMVKGQNPVPSQLVLSAQSVSAEPADYPTKPRLKEMLPGKLVGAALRSYNLVDGSNRVYATTLLEQYNTIVAENAFEPQQVWKGRLCATAEKKGSGHTSKAKCQNWYDFSKTDEIVNYANEKGLTLRGHALVYSAQNADFLKKLCGSGQTTNCVESEFSKFFVEEDGSKTPIETLLHDYITDFVSMYKGKIAQWNVLNEALVEVSHEGQGECNIRPGTDPDAQTLRCDFWRKHLGDDYPAKLFHWAHDADPQAELYYNDYCNDGGCQTAGMECELTKSQLVYEAVKRWLLAGAPIHGVGWQSHVPAGYQFGSGQWSLAQLYQALRLKVMITELDARIPCSSNLCDVPPTKDELDAQAKTYASVMKFCLTMENCRGVVSWGFTDAYTWITGVPKSSYPDFHAPLPFWATSSNGRTYDPKPAYCAMVGLPLKMCKY